MWKIKVKATQLLNMLQLLTWQGKLTRKLGSNIKQLLEIYGKEYIHNIEHCEGLADYTVSLKYLPKLKCTENEIIGKFNSMWYILNKVWLKYKDFNPKNTRTKRFLNYILEQYSVQYSNIAVLILIIFAISPGTRHV